MRHEHNPVVQQLAGRRVVALELDYNDFIMLTALLGISGDREIQDSVRQIMSSRGFSGVEYDGSSGGRDNSQVLYTAMISVVRDIGKGGF